MRQSHRNLSDQGTRFINRQGSAALDSLFKIFTFNKFSDQVLQSIDTSCIHGVDDLRML